MKTILLTISVISLFLFTSCDKEKKRVEIIKDCTGVYLREKKIDVKVCNTYLLDSYNTGDKIKVNYDILGECFGLIEPITCTTSHPYQDLVEVTKIY